MSDDPHFAAARPDPSAEVERLRQDRQELTKALTGLTCGGSEFFVRKGDDYVADTPACVAWIRRSREDAIRGRIEAIRREKAAQSCVAYLEVENGRLRERAEVAERERDAAREVLRMLEWSANAQSPYGFGREEYPICPACQGWMPRKGVDYAHGHAPGCALAAQIAGPAQGREGAPEVKQRRDGLTSDRTDHPCTVNDLGSEVSDADRSDLAPAGAREARAAQEDAS